MSELTNNPTFAIWSAAAVFLFLKMNAISLYQGYVRSKTHTGRPQEDAGLFGAQKSGPEPEALTRANACWRNDLENIPMFLFVALAFVFFNPWNSVQVYGALTLVFCAARALHTVTYLAKLQPWRTIAYTLAGAVTSVMCVGVVWDVIVRFA